MTAASRLIVQDPQGTRMLEIEPTAPPRVLSQLLRQAGLPLNTRCGQRALCDGCFVELLSGALLHTVSGQRVAAAEHPQPIRGCEYQPIAGEDVTIHVPARSLLAHQPQVVTAFRVNVSRAHDPLWQRLSCPELAGAAQVPCGTVLADAIARQRDRDLPVRADASLAALAGTPASHLSLALEQRGDYWALLPWSGRSDRPIYGAAIDVGTTTVVVLLVDLANGEVVATASSLNGQTKLGDNVLTRINLCMTEPAMLGLMQEAIAQETLVPLLDQVLTEAGVSPAHLACLVVAGNTTMLHLLAGVDPSPLGAAPFTPVFLDHRVLPASELSLIGGVPGPSSAPETMPEAGFAASPLSALAHLLPGAAAYVGSDITAGVLSSGMAYRTDTCLLVDVGTNGEIVLKHGERLLGCATAAGPAFEGAGLKCGVRAGRGAISHIRLEQNPRRPEIEVIGGDRPIGLCGTAYVDFIAQARQVELIGSTGRYSAESLAEGLVTQPDHARIYTVAYSRGREPIVVSEADIASLLQAKAAIAAGILCLLDRVGLKPQDVDTLYLAGGFGFHLDIDNVIRCGLLPGFRREQIHLAGNTSLAGAYLALLDSGVLAEIKRISSRLEIVELNLDPHFESHYIDQLSLPDDAT